MKKLKMGQFVYVSDAGEFLKTYETSRAEIVLMEREEAFYVLVSRIVAGIFEDPDDAKEAFYDMKWRYVPVSEILSGKTTKENIRDEEDR